MLQRKYSKTGIIVRILLSCAIVTASLFLAINRQRVVDQITVWRFQTTTEINALVERSGMNNYGKFLYLASQPKIESTQRFNEVCDRVENITSILGCYSNYNIYIYNVTDPQLDGIREVTATHETLHAVYLRLSDGEKNKVNALLELEYKKLETNKDFSDRMAFYARTEPGQRDNELHSLIGTEVADISPELKTYYEKYFSDRQKVVELNAGYISVFQKLADRAKGLSDQMNSIALSVNSRSDQYNTDVRLLNDDILTFNAKANNSGFMSQAQFIYERNDLLDRVATLETMQSNINNDVATYDIIIAEYNSIASESKKLYNSIDSTLAPLPSVYEV